METFELRKSKLFFQHKEHLRLQGEGLFSFPLTPPDSHREYFEAAPQLCKIVQFFAWDLKAGQFSKNHAEVSQRVLLLASIYSLFWRTRLRLIVLWSQTSWRLVEGTRWVSCQISEAGQREGEQRGDYHHLSVSDNYYNNDNGTYIITASCMDSPPVSDT